MARSLKGGTSPSTRLSLGVEAAAAAAAADSAAEAAVVDTRAERAEARTGVVATATEVAVADEVEGVTEVEVVTLAEVEAMEGEAVEAEEDMVLLLPGAVVADPGGKTAAEAVVMTLEN